MGKVVLRIGSAKARMTSAAWLVFLIGASLALGACSKCDVPDFTHWRSGPQPHACDNGAPSK